MDNMIGVRNPRFTALAGVAVGLLAAGGQAARAASDCEGVGGNLVANCGFEQIGSSASAVTGWSTGGPNGAAFSLAGFGDQHSGNRHLLLGFGSPGSSFVSQVVGGPGTYNVSFWLDLYSQGVPTNPAPTLTITLGDQTLPVSLSVTNTQNTNYRYFEFFNVTTATSAELRFTTTGNLPSVQYVYLFVDDVAVASAVPEPSSLALGLASLAGLALWRRKPRSGRPCALRHPEGLARLRGWGHVGGN